LNQLNDLERAKLNDKLKQQEKAEAEEKEAIDNRASKGFRPS
jgi:hypothetical protein